LRPYGDLDRYWTGYLELEREFSEFTNLVPLISENSNVISPRLANIASLTGNWIETTFRRMAKSGWPFQQPACNVPQEIEDIDTFRNTFEVPYRLSKRAVFVKSYLTELHRRIFPFQSFGEGKNPEWFKDYSRLKHDRLELQKSMTLRKVTDAMAGLFLLSVYPHEMREYLLEQRIIHSKGPDKSEVVKKILVSHPSVLPDEIPLEAWVEGPIIAETQMFMFEFPRRIGPDNLETEREGYLDSRWEVWEARRKSDTQSMFR
jgi:hypothetical protein